MDDLDAASLDAFYKDVVGLERQEGMGEHALQLGAGTTLGFDGHSELTGPTKEPARVLLNAFVDEEELD